MLQKTKEAELQAELIAIQKKIAKAEAKANVYAEEEEKFASLTKVVKERATLPSADKTSHSTFYIRGPGSVNATQLSKEVGQQVPKKEISKVEVVPKVPRKWMQTSQKTLELTLSRKLMRVWRKMLGR